MTWCSTNHESVSAVNHHDSPANVSSNPNLMEKWTQKYLKWSKKTEWEKHLINIKIVLGPMSHLLTWRRQGLCPFTAYSHQGAIKTLWLHFHIQSLVLKSYLLICLDLPTRLVPGGDLPEARGSCSSRPPPAGLHLQRPRREAEGEGAPAGGRDRHPEELLIPVRGRTADQGALSLLGVCSRYLRSTSTRAE